MDIISALRTHEMSKRGWLTLEEVAAFILDYNVTDIEVLGLELVHNLELITDYDEDEILDSIGEKFEGYPFVIKYIRQMASNVLAGRGTYPRDNFIFGAGIIGVAGIKTDCAKKLKEEIKYIMSEQYIESEKPVLAKDEALEGPVIDKILDANHPDYAPDLAIAIRLWHSLYGQDQRTEHSHSRGTAIFLDRQPLANTAKDRIKEIATPRKDWNKQRLEAARNAVKNCPP